MQQRRQDAETVKNATTSTDITIAEVIASTKTQFLASLEKIETSLVAERRKLTTIQEAIKIEEKRLADLYELTVGVDSLSAILLAQKE